MNRTAPPPLVGVAALLAGLVILLGLNAPVRADVFYVGRPEHWLEMQDTFRYGPVFDTASEALARAADGDTIILLQDVDELLVIERRVSLLGYGHRVRPRLSRPLVVLADGVLLDQLHFQGVVGTAVTLQGVTGARMTRCFVTECTNGVLLKDSSACVLEDNRLLFAGKSIDVRGGGGNLLRRNTVDSGGFHAVTLEASPDNRLVGNQVRRSGWTGILLHSRSDRTQLLGNVVDGSDIGISIQTDDNVLRENVFIGSQHGLLLGRSPLGKDSSVHDRIAYLDSDSADTNVISNGNLIEQNVFQASRRDGLLLKQACDNVIRGNRITAGLLHGIVLMGGADDNVIEDNLIGAHPGAAVCIVKSRGNQVRGNRLDEDAVVRLVDGADNTIEAARVQELADGELLRSPQHAPDGSAFDIVWGDFHTHSLLSDGASTPEELLSYGRDVVGLDFLALSDHAEYVGQGDGRWETLERLVQDASVPGRFVGIPGYETTFAVGWSAHFNVYFAGPGGHVYMAPHGGKAWIPNLATLVPDRLIEKLRADGEDTLVIRHHYWSTARYWRESPPDSDILPMTEVCSVHGIWTGDRDVDSYPSDRAGEIRGHAGTMRGGLADGRMFAVGGGSDTHYGFPGDSAAVAVLLPRRDDGSSPLDAPALFEAIRARRTYATTGARIGLAFSVDGQPMGSAIDGRGIPVVEARVAGSDVLEELVLFENETIVHAATLDGSHSGSLSWSPDRAPLDGTYYQVRVRQADGELAWSTPVWIRPRPPTIAGDDVFADRERVSLLLYSAVLRAWPDLSSPELEGRSPRQALADPRLADTVRALWPRWLETAQAINARAVEQGLVDRAAAAELIQAYGWRFGPLPPPIRMEPIVDPLVDVQAVRERLGL